MTEGMWRDKGFDGKGGMGGSIRISDMRPREVFLAGDLVSCPGGMPGVGWIAKIEPDNRLALVCWSGGAQGW